MVKHLRFWVVVNGIIESLSDAVDKVGLALARPPTRREDEHLPGNPFDLHWENQPHFRSSSLESAVPAVACMCVRGLLGTCRMPHANGQRGVDRQLRRANSVAGMAAAQTVSVARVSHSATEPVANPSPTPESLQLGR